MKFRNRLYTIEETQQARLQQIRSYQTRRIAIESSEEREARLALLRRNQLLGWVVELQSLCARPARQKCHAFAY